MDEVQAQLIAEQLKHANTLMRADVEALRAELAHYRELTNLRLTELETARSDHEQRIRAASDGIVQFKVFSGLTNGGASLISVLALVKAFFLGR